ncbi:MAG: RNA methyltransferase [Clostridia bacterium]|nr:RNA methyltransferase [Clostridia bacterium]
MNNINCEKITSRKNPKIAAACSLADKKSRDSTGLFVAEGIKLIKELILEGVKIHRLFFTEKAKNRFYDTLIKAQEAGCELYEVTDEVYEKLSAEKNPEGIFAQAQKTSVYGSCADTPGSGGFLILDGIQNPSNVGTVIRTASALGISRILLGEGCADIFSHKTLRASMGSLFKVHICITEDLCGEIDYLKKQGAHIYAAMLDKDSTDIRSAEFSRDDCIVLGNEGNGISDKVSAVCDRKVIIPMQLGTESLNAASAAAILMWEKQKGVLE